MAECPICKASSGTAQCVCGYSFDGEPLDWQKLRARYDSEKDWRSRAEIVRSSHRISGNPPLREFAASLEIGLGTAARDIRLAIGLDQYPELATQPNAFHADNELKILNGRRRGKASTRPDARFYNEDELQKCLVDHWQITCLGKEWDLCRHNGHFDTREVGTLDILARHKNRPAWLIVELKVGKPSDNVLGQLLRYMGWIRARHAAEGEAIEGLVIGSERDPQITYGLGCLPNVQFICYRRTGAGLELFNPIFDEASTAIESLTDTEREELLSKLKLMQISSSNNSNPENNVT